MVAFHTNFMPLFCLGAIDAKYYYCGIKAHTIMLEAMWRLFWEEFLEWLKRENYEWRSEHRNVFLQELHSEFNGEETNKIRIKEKYQVTFQFSSSSLSVDVSK